MIRRAFPFIAMPFTVLVILFGVTGTEARADLNPTSGDRAILIVSGVGADRETVTFDRHALKNLPTETISTSTIWAQGVQTFTGVPLHRLIDFLDIQKGYLRVTAVNDYSISIPVADAVQDGPIIAYLHNGEEMTLRSKGPLRLIYPYDSDPKYQTELIFARSVWHLNRIEVTQ